MFTVPIFKGFNFFAFRRMVSLCLFFFFSFPVYLHCHPYDVQNMDGAQTILKYPFWVSALLLIVFLILIINIFLLRKKVARRTNLLIKEVDRRKKIEIVLKKSHDQLELRVRDRTEELTKANSNLVHEILYCNMAEKTLRSREEGYRFFFENNDAVIIFVNPENAKIVFANMAAVKFYGYDIKQLIGMSAHEINTLSEDEMKIVIAGAKKRKSNYYIFKHILANGTIRDVEIHQSKLFFSGQKVFAIIIHDITERKQLEKQLAASLDEKVVLLREIHHRVKNNMQVIISLLRIHARKTSDKKLEQIFADCRDRINSMSLIHESLYQSDDLAKIDFKNYLKKLCKNINRAYDASGKGIEVMVDQCDVKLGMDQGIAIGMVITELVSNAFKHAFPPGKGGIISVNLSSLEGKTIELIIQDSGKGIPPHIDIYNSLSIGLRLATATVTHELGGSINMEQDNGTRFIIHFENQNE